MERNGELRIDKIEMQTAGPEAAESGLLGFVKCRLNGRLQLAGIALRRTRDGRPTLSFPAKTDAAGVRQFVIRPMDDRTRREIEAQVFRALGLAA